MTLDLHGPAKSEIARKLEMSQWDWTWLLASTAVRMGDELGLPQGDMIRSGAVTRIVEHVLERVSEIQNKEAPEG